MSAPSVLISALARAALDAGWVLEVAQDGQDERGLMLVVGFRPNPSLYGANSSAARAKARVAMVSSAFMERYRADTQRAIDEGLVEPPEIEPGVDGRSIDR